MGGSQLVPHPDDCHDTLCLPAAVEHDASAHRIGAAAVDGQDQGLHCLVCDWIRGFRPHAEIAFQPAPAPAAGVPTSINVFPVALSTRAAQPPLRSPPLSPQLA